MRISGGHHQGVQSLPAHTVAMNLGDASPVIMRKLGPPLLAGEPTPCGEHFAPVVLSFTHDALPNVDFTREQPVRLEPL